MPSTTSFSTPNDWPSSTVITPSLPTDSMASAIILPISGSLALMEATWVISSLVEICLLIFFSLPITSPTSFSMPCRISMGLIPAATNLRPSLIMAWARTVAVVVPSPAVSLVLEATSFTRAAPTFSNLSSKSISLATVTPSLVMVGLPNPWSITTLRPLGPKVTFTALASWSTPFLRAARALSS